MRREGVLKAEEEELKEKKNACASESTRGGVDSVGPQVAAKVRKDIAKGMGDRLTNVIQREKKLEQREKDMEQREKGVEKRLTGLTDREQMTDQKERNFNDREISLRLKALEVKRLRLELEQIEFEAKRRNLGVGEWHSKRRKLNPPLKTPNPETGRRR
jgi:uncharacterized protein (DUF3084 family)